MKEIEKIIINETVSLEKKNITKSTITINLKELDYIKNNIGLTISEKEFLFDILSHVSVGTNMIITDESKIATQLDIGKMLNLEPRSIQRKFKGLLSKKIIHSIKIWNKSYYVLNPYIFQSEYVLGCVYKLFDILEYKKDDNRVVKIKDKIFVITKEKVLELILSSNLNIIEDGMTLIKTQYEVANGFIDILAKDKYGITTIIEIKNKKDDPKLVEQCVYYPTQFDEKTRFISIAPSYSNKLFNTIASLGYVEIKSYSVENNQLIVNDFKLIS